MKEREIPVIEDKKKLGERGRKRRREETSDQERKGNSWDRRQEETSDHNREKNTCKRRPKVDLYLYILNRSCMHDKVHKSFFTKGTMKRSWEGS